MNCPRCNAPLPDNARFCYSCGAQLGAPGPAPGGAPPGYGAPAGYGAPPPYGAPAPGYGMPPGPPPPQAGWPGQAPAAAAPPPMDPKNLKCPTCGAPLNAEMGDQVLTCAYCGGTVSLGGGGWAALNRHTLLTVSITDPTQAMGVVKAHMDKGLFHHKDFEQSQLVSQKLTFVPFWIVAANATSNVTYQDVAASIGGTMATLAAAEALSGAEGRGRGPVFIGSQPNPIRQDTITGHYEFPVVAVKGLAQYQPKNYQFALPDRIAFQKGKVPGGAPLLNGDLSEESAKMEARSLVSELQAAEARKRHPMVQQVNSNVEVGEAELLHAPVWQFILERKGNQTTILLDGHSNRVMV
ncbi:MAG TPA: zinc ribbon domain-containing protein [Thermoplasmata archaeon]|nr:zinc ribbon domain-containing protein [Thermoplasmata archaeon]